MYKCMCKYIAVHAIYTCAQHRLGILRVAAGPRLMQRREVNLRPRRRGLFKNNPEDPT